MKLQFEIILGILCLNLGFYMANNLYVAKSNTAFENQTFQPVTPPITPEELNKTASEKRPSISGGTLGFIDHIISGFSFIVDLLSGVFFGLPNFMVQIGVPAIIYMPVYALISLVWGIFLFEALTGRRVTE